MMSYSEFGEGRLGYLSYSRQAEFARTPESLARFFLCSHRQFGTQPLMKRVRGKLQ